MVRHMDRAHHKAYRAALRGKGRLPEWIGIEKEKRRKALRAKRAGGEPRAAKAKRASRRQTLLKGKTRSPGLSEASTSSESVPLESQVQVRKHLLSDSFQIIDFSTFVGSSLGYNGVCRL